MKIESALIHSVFPPPFKDPVSDSTLGPFGDFPVSILELECAGITGRGVLPVSEMAHHLAKDLFLPLLWQCEIEDILSIERFWDLAWKRIRNMGTGITLYVLNGIDLALWDIVAKKANQPLFKLLGAKRDRIAGYATNGWVNFDLPKLIATLEDTVERGFRIIKVKVGVDQGTRMDEDVRRIKAVRKALGEKIGIAVDSNQCWTVEQALRFAHHIADQNILWFEEPIPARDFFGYQHLVEKSPIPIAAGETLCEPDEYATLLKLRGVSIVQPFACTLGGITPFRRVAQIAADVGVRLTTGGFSPLTCNLVAAASTGYLTEYPIPMADTFSSLLQRAPQFVNGEFHLLNLPGHGVLPDPDFVKRYSKRNPERIEPGAPATIQVF
jgi:L-alanine-DL-glutamate epimerase-like enolase superfamily enzyme